MVLAQSLWSKLLYGSQKKKPIQTKTVRHFHFPHLILEKLEDRWNPTGLETFGTQLTELSNEYPSTEIAIVDFQLLPQIPKEEILGSQVIAINDSSDLISQFDAALSTIKDISVLRLISHGEAGALLFGNQKLDMQTLKNHASEANSWAKSFAPNADILVYGCSVASNPQGQDFINHLATITHANVAASTDPTGYLGNTNLEFVHGTTSHGIKGTQTAWDQSGLNLAFTNLEKTTFYAELGNTFTLMDNSSATYPFQLTKGNLPSGVSFNEATGIIQGIPTADSPGTYALAFSRNIDGLTQETQDFTLVVKPRLLPNERIESFDPNSGTSWRNTQAFAALKTDGGIFSWGDPRYGGTGAPTDNGYVQIYSNSSAFAALRKDGSIATWGDPDSGGINGPNDKGYIEISSTGGAFAALKEDGSISSWGKQYAGGMGAPTEKGFIKIYSNAYSFTALRPDGSVISWSTTNSSANFAPTDKNYYTIFSNSTVFCGLKKDGSITTWPLGSGPFGSPQRNGFVSISSNGRGFAALNADGTISCWGSGDSGEPTDSGYIRIFSNSSGYAALKADGTIYSWGDITTAGKTPPQGSGYSDVFANDSSFVATKENGEIAAWGNVPEGFNNLFLDKGNYRFIPATSGFTVLKPDGSLISWGKYAFDKSYLAPTGNNFTQVFSFDYTFLGLTTDGKIISWGDVYPFDDTVPIPTDIITVSTIKEAAPWFSNPSENNLYGSPGSSFFYQIPIKGKPSPTISISSGQLPKGLQLNPKNGQISGVLEDTQSSPSSFTISISNDSGVTQKQYTISLIPQPVFEVQDQPVFQVGKNSTFSVKLKSEIQPEKFELAGDPLPSGLSFDPKNGTISGNPEPGTGGSYHLVVKPTNWAWVGQPIEQPLTLTILESPQIYSLPTATFYQGTGNTFTVLANGYPKAPIQIDPATIPLGLQFDPNTGILSGNPEESFPGNYRLIFSINNGIGSKTTNYLNLQIKTYNNFTNLPSIYGTSKELNPYSSPYLNLAITKDGHISNIGNSIYSNSDLPTDSGYIQLYPNNYGFAALKNDGSITTLSTMTALRDGGPKDKGYVKVFSTPSDFCALKSDGTVFTWQTYPLTYSVGPTDSGYKSIVTNNGSFAALKDDGTLFLWDGIFGSGYLAPGKGYHSIEPNQIGFSALKEDGSVAFFSTYEADIVPPPTDNGYIKLFHNLYSFAALKADGTIASWGYNLTGGTQAPTGSSFVEIFPTLYSFAALQSDGAITTWGYKDNWTTFEPKDNGYIWIYPNQNAFVGIKPDGSLTSWGDPTSGTTGAPTNIGYTTIQAGGSNFAALRSDGSVDSWGYFPGFSKEQNFYKPGGSGFSRLYFSFGIFTAQRPDGSLASWGSNNNSNLTIQTPTGTGYGKVLSSAGGFSSIGTNGAIYTWGPYGLISSEKNGFVAIGSTDPQAPWFTGENQKVIYASSGFKFQYKLFAGGTPNPKFVITGGKLPTGVFLDSATGTLVGLDGNQGVGNIPLQISAVNDEGTTSLSITLKFTNPISFTSQNNASFTTDTSLYYKLGVTKNLPDPVFSLSGDSLPQGISFDSISGAFTGTAPKGSYGTYRFRISVLNWAGADSSQDFTLKLYQQPEFTSLTSTDFQIGSGNTFTVLATGFPLGKIQLLDGLLPKGVLFQSSTGLLSGTPAPGTEGTYPLKFSLNTGIGNVATYQLLLKVKSKTDPRLEQINNPLAPHDQKLNDTAFAALRDDGTIYAWGDPAAGGTDEPTDKGYIQIYSNKTSFAALKPDGSITAWGDAENGGTGAPTDKGYTYIYSNGFSFAAIKSDGSLSSWGSPSFGGNGTPMDNGYTRVIPSSFGYTAIKTDGSLSYWGTPFGSNTPAPKKSGFTQVIWAGSEFAGLNGDGTISGWGNTTDYRQPPTDSGYISLYSNNRSFSALKSDGSISTWGDGGADGPTGKGFIKVFSSYSSFAALRSDGSIYSWGGNSFFNSFPAPKDTGYINIISTTDQFVAIKENGSISSWGNYSQTNSINQPLSSHFKEILTNGSSFSAIDMHGGIEYWSDQSYPNLPPSGKNFNYIYFNTQSFAGIDTLGEISSWGSPDGGGSRSPTGSGFHTIYSNRAAYAALNSDGKIFTWGIIFNGANGAPTGSGFVSLATPYQQAPWFTFETKTNLKAQASQIFNYQPPVRGFPNPNYSIASGSLPEGIVLDPKSGLLSGKPTKIGNYSFTISASNGAGTPTNKNFSIQVVKPFNDPPIGADSTLVIHEDNTTVLKEADFGFLDPMDQPSNGFNSVKIITLPLKGNLTLSGKTVVLNQEIYILDIRAGKLAYTPQGNLSGDAAASFSFKVRDNGGVNNGGIDTALNPNTIYWNIKGGNDAPTGKDKTISLNEDTSYSISSTDFGFSDTLDSPSNNLASILITSIPKNGKLSLNGQPVKINDEIQVSDFNNGLLVFTPASQFNGSDSITFRVRDDGGTEWGGTNLDLKDRKLTWKVVPVNDPPTGSDKNITFLEDAFYRFKISDFGFKDSLDNPSNQFQSVIVTSLPKLGILYLSGKQIPLGTEIPVEEIKSNRFIYAPPPNANGLNYSSFGFKVRDNGGTKNNGNDISFTSNAINFQITPVNDAPTGKNKTVTVAKGSSYFFTLSDFGFNDGRDIPANNLNRIQIVSLPIIGKGSLTLKGVAIKANSFINRSDISSLKWKYTPPPKAFGKGLANFQFRIEDDGGTQNGGKNLSTLAYTITIDVN